MKEIDFLPAEMLRQRAMRSQRQWQILLASMFVAALIGSYALQAYCRHELARTLDQLAPQYKTARQQQQQLKQLRAAAGQYHEAAALYALLQHPWPRTQLLAALLSRLTEEIHLSSVCIAPAAGASRSGNISLQTTQLTASNSESALPPARKDWQRLLDEARARPPVMEITGTTTDAAALHQVLTQLTQSPLFTSSRLVSLTSVEGSAALLRFTLVVEVQTPHGVPQDAPPQRMALNVGRAAP